MPIISRIIRILGIIIGIILFIESIRGAILINQGIIQAIINIGVWPILSLPLVVPWSKISKRWIKISLYIILWVDAIFALLVIISLTEFLQAPDFANDTALAHLRWKSIVVFVIVVLHIPLMRHTFFKKAEKNAAH